MARNDQVRRYEQGLSFQDLDMFADLEWEREVSERSAHRHTKRKADNLSAVIEDYLRSYP